LRGGDLGFPVKGRTTVFVDGFNLYHSLKEDARYHRYKWLNLRKLAECFVPSENLDTVLYFTSYADWNPRKTKRHQHYIRALAAHDVETVLGRFKPKTLTCLARCGEQYRTHEEKQTDVNIALALLERAFLGKYDSAVLITGDTDIVPAVEAVVQNFPDKPVFLVKPFRRKAEELIRVCTEHRKIYEKHLKRSLLDNPVVLPDGQKLFCPDKWE
jgi:uncharacterized LabA/DUF88 family protein